MNCILKLNKEVQCFCLDPSIVKNKNIEILDQKIDLKYNKPWTFCHEFLKYYRTYIKRVKTTLKNEESKCPFCDFVDKEKLIYYNIGNGYNFCWGSLTYHMIKKHNFEPKNKFIKFILSLSSRSFFKLGVNDMVLFEGLMNAGGLSQKFKYNIKKKIVEGKIEKITKERTYIYSEYSGYFDIKCKNKICNVENIEISNYRRAEPDIYMVNFFFDKLKNKKYVFHTHPPTPTAGGRIQKERIVFEFPSIQDIESFLIMENKSEIEGELIFAPEGIYVLSIYDINKGFKKKQFEDTRKFLTILNEAYNEYKNIKTEEDFYKIVAQDFKYIKKINELLKKYNLQVSYYPKENYENNKWIYGKIYLPIR